MSSSEPRPPEHEQAYPAEKARQGRIILRTRVQRIIFIAGLAGAVLLGLVWILLAAKLLG